MSCVDKDTEATIISVGSGVIAIVGLILFYQRLKKQEEQIDLQRKQRTDDRFTTAVSYWVVAKLLLALGQSIRFTT